MLLFYPVVDCDTRRLIIKIGALERGLSFFVPIYPKGIKIYIAELSNLIHTVQFYLLSSIFIFGKKEFISRTSVSAKYRSLLAPVSSELAGTHIEGRF